jgi:hypothetical protein
MLVDRPFESMGGRRLRVINDLGRLDTLSDVLARFNG